MKRRVAITLTFLALLIFGAFSAANADMEEYCQVPPFLSTPVEPNVLFVVDVSGSMGWTPIRTETRTVTATGFLTIIIRRYLMKDISRLQRLTGVRRIRLTAPAQTTFMKKPHLPACPARPLVSDGGAGTLTGEVVFGMAEDATGGVAALRNRLRETATSSRATILIMPPCRGSTSSAGQ